MPAQVLLASALEIVETMSLQRERVLSTGCLGLRVSTRLASLEATAPSPNIFCISIGFTQQNGCISLLTAQQQPGPSTSVDMPT